MIFHVEIVRTKMYSRQGQSFLLSLYSASWGRDDEDGCSMDCFNVLSGFKRLKMHSWVEWLIISPPGKLQMALAAFGFSYMTCICETREQVTFGIYITPTA